MAERDPRKRFYLRVHLGRHAVKLSDISAPLMKVFPEAHAVYGKATFEIMVLAPEEIEDQIRTWFAFILEV